MITRLLNYYVHITLLINLCNVYGDVKSSLTFVIDSTSSMGKEIRQVKNATNAIFETVLKSNESQIEDFILVTFNDPDRRKQTEYLLSSFNKYAFNLSTITKDRKVFKDALADIIPYGGFECPEYSMAGIMQGILNSRPMSTIYVFTDATSKDYKEYERVRNLAIKRQAQVVFVLTGDCNKTKDSPDFKVYHDLAKVTDGAIFHLEKYDVNKIMNDIIDTVISRGTVIGNWRFPNGTHEVQVYLDRKIINPKVTVNGKDVDLEIIRPDGQTADVEYIMSTNGTTIVKILNPLPGDYNIKVNGPSDVHVLVTGKTEVKFLQGFSTVEASTIADTSTTPLPDEKSYITIHVTDGNITLNTLKIIENNGNKLFKEIPLKIVSAKDNIYTTDPVELPKTLFKLAIVGLDPLSNTNITRYGPLVQAQPSIAPVGMPNKAPEVSILGNTTIDAEFNKPLEIKCLVKGNPQPDIVWLDKSMANNQTTSESVTLVTDGYLSILKIDNVTQTGEYECTALNPFGSDSKTVLVNTTVGMPNKAPEVSILGNTTIDAEFNKPLEIKCLVKGNPQPDIVWLDKSMANHQTTSESVTEVTDGYLSILKIDNVTQTGEYECTALNPLGVDSKTVLIKTTITPYLKMLNKSRDVFIDYLSEGELVCKVDAYPPASITWYKDQKGLTKDLAEFSGDNSVIKITNMTQNHNGNYICEARNTAGRKFITVNVKMSGIEIPVIDKNLSIPSIMVGSDIDLSCEIVKGIPEPNITWYYSPGESHEFMPMDQWNDKEYVTLYNVKKSDDGGIYRCEARNEFGYDYREHKLVVEYPPVIRRDKPDYTTSVGQSLYIPCFVTGVPKPQVMWYKDEELLVNSKDIRIFRDHSIRIRVGINAAGIYKCNATNKLGNATKVAKLNVYVPISITSPKQSKFDVSVGSTLTLPCKASGYPMPRTAWTYTKFNSTEKKPLLEQLAPSSIKLRSMQPVDEGYYTCNASNIGGSLLLTYEIHVFAPPSIENIYTEKQFNPVEGDLSLRIECSASGNPQPTIRWKKQGYYVAEGDDVSIENGTLILKHITEDAGGYYVCEASNSLGSDREIYEVNVLSYAYSGPPTSNILVLEGESSQVKCDIPRNRIDQLRWYKDGVMIHKGELTIKDAKVSDGGLYTCRVSSFEKSTSGHTMVTVGSKPRFVKEEETNIELEGDLNKTVALGCEVFGVPQPEITWWHNGQLLNTTDEYHHLKMELGSRGQYKCVASNDFGDVAREFKVKKEECLIDLTNKSQLQPLIVGKHLNLPHNAIRNGWVSIQKNDYVFLFCPNGFKIFPRRRVVAFCVGDNIVKVQGVPFDFSSIECTQKVKHVIEKTGETCLAQNTEMLRIGFQLPTGTVRAYEVCMDNNRNVPVFTKQRMPNSVADVDYLETEWSDADKFGLNFKDAYDPDKQLVYISKNLWRIFHFDDKCSFEMRQLVSPRDLLPGVVQRTAYSYLNVVPHWSTCNNETNNWNEVEKRVRALAKSSNSELLVWTGVAEHLAVPDYKRRPQFIQIGDGSSSQPIPRYLWKVVQNPSTGSSLAIIQVNAPDLSTSAALPYVKCTDICNDTEWMKGSTWHDTTRGYTFCCSLFEFQTRFGFINVFENHPYLLTGAELPDYAPYIDTRMLDP